MKEVSITRGKVALVDDEDFERVSQFRWQAKFSHGQWRACRIIGPRGDRHNEVMHRVILQAPADKQVDHVNGNGLDNQKANLRLCESKQQQWNMHARRGKSGFKGVFEKRRQGYQLRKPWLASIVVDQKPIYLGYFATAEEAARAYDRAAREHFGEFAQPNFPEVTA